MLQLHQTTLGRFLKKSNTDLPYDPAIPLLGIYPREMKAHILTITCVQNVYSSISGNSPKLEIIQISIS